MKTLCNVADRILKNRIGAPSVHFNIVCDDVVNYPIKRIFFFLTHLMKSILKSDEILAGVARKEIKKSVCRINEALCMKF